MSVEDHRHPTVIASNILRRSDERTRRLNHSTQPNFRWSERRRRELIVDRKKLKYHGPEVRGVSSGFLKWLNDLLSVVRKWDLGVPQAKPAVVV